MKSVLSIQSHVVHGYVGGRAAIFPLQSQGWEVDNINTVHFSNHTGYGHFTGTSLACKELDSILDQLINNLDIEYSAVITGYIPNAELIACISRYILQIKQRNTPLEKPLYLFDPVMGDNDYMYVDKSCVEEYRNLIKLRIADIITPNQFELQLLSGIKISCRNSLKEALDKIHEEYGVPYIVVTSVDSKIVDGSESRNNSNSSKNIYCIISVKPQADKLQQEEEKGNETKLAMFQIPQIESYFTGVGDLFSALLLDKFVANNHLENKPFQRLSRAVNQVLTIMKWTLKLTYELGMDQARKAHCGEVKCNNTISNGTSNGNGHIEDEEIVGKMNDANTMKHFELKIIQARKYYDYDGEGEFKEMNVEF